MSIFFFSFFFFLFCYVAITFKRTPLILSSMSHMDLFENRSFWRNAMTSESPSTIYSPRKYVALELQFIRPI